MIDILVLMLSLVASSYVWVLWSTRYLTEEQIINKEFPWWIIVPSCIVYYLGGLSIIYSVVLVILKLAGVI